MQTGPARVSYRGREGKRLWEHLRGEERGMSRFVSGSQPGPPS